MKLTRISPCSFLLKSAIVFAAITFIWMVASAVFWWRFWRSDSIDYSQREPAKVFRMVLNQSVPIGVSDIQVAGEGLLIGHEVWMKYDANNSAIGSLLKNKKLTLDGPYNSLIWITRKQILHDKHAREVGWNEVLQSKHLEYYSYSSVSSGSGWIGEVVMDRKNNLVYTYSSAV